MTEHERAIGNSTAKARCRKAWADRARRQLRGAPSALPGAEGRDPQGFNDGEYESRHGGFQHMSTPKATAKATPVLWCAKQPSGRLYWQSLGKDKRKIAGALYPDWERRGWTIVRVRVVEQDP